MAHTLAFVILRFFISPSLLLELLTRTIYFSEVLAPDFHANAVAVSKVRPHNEVRIKVHVLCTAGSSGQTLKLYRYLAIASNRQYPARAEGQALRD